MYLKQDDQRQLTHGRVEQERGISDDVQGGKRWSLLEEIVLGFSVKLVHAQLEHLQTSGSLFTKKQICGYICFQSYKATLPMPLQSHLHKYTLLSQLVLHFVHFA